MARGGYIGVKLTDETGKVVVFEVLRKQIPCKFRGSPYNEAGAVFVPGN